jgi:type II secretory pathway pseudopilin PulG
MKFTPSLDKLCSMFNKEILNRVQNDSYGDLAVCHPRKLDDMKKTKTSRKKVAFTLVETLIAIGIIGVVSALTIPTLMKNYQQRQTIVQLKKVYSILQQAVRSAQNDYGDMSGWDFALPSEDFVNTYIAPYVAVSKTSVTIPITDLRGKKVKKLYTHSMSNGILFYYARGFGYNVVFDLNGQSGPNRAGRDVFIFDLFQDSVWPYNQYYVEDIKLLCRQHGNNVTGGGTSGQCSKRADGGIIGAGSYCSTVIFCNKWTFPKNYPWN